MSHSIFSSILFLHTLITLSETPLTIPKYRFEAGPLYAPSLIFC